MFMIPPNPKERRVKERDAKNAIVRALAKYQYLGLNSYDQMVMDFQGGDFQGGRAYSFSKHELTMLDEIKEQLEMVEKYFSQKVTEKDMRAKKGGT